MENNIPKFTFCITSKNNLRYLKHAVHYINQNSNRNHDILVFIDADNDGTEDWCKANQIQYIKNPSKELFGIGNAYNLLVEKSKTDFVVIYHADMIMGKGFDTALFKLWKPKTVVSATRIEPPLHPSDPAKVVLDLGLWPESTVEQGFREDPFNEFVEKNASDNVTNGIFAPWLIHKDDFNNVGGHDPIMKSHSEDRDLFNRFLLSGYALVQSWQAFVYHLTCRGGQFEHAATTQDLTYKSTIWNQLAHTQTREFVRKWGSPPGYDQYQYPIITPKYDIGFVVENISDQLLNALEPWCSTMYIQDSIIRDTYCSQEQVNTKFNLKDRVRTKNFNDPDKPNNIVVEFNASKLTNENFQLLTQLPQIIEQTNELGQFELDIFTITIKDLTQYQNNLIHIYN